MLEHSPKIIAVAGKGGVGKTSISAAFVRLLTEAYPDKRILAIDADPAVGLSTALGVEVKETLDDIRKSIVSRHRPAGDGGLLLQGERLSEGGHQPAGQRL